VSKSSVRTTHFTAVFCFACCYSQGKGKGGIPVPCSRPNDYSPECLPPIFDCPIIDIATTCSDGSIGPFDQSTCLNICPPTGDPQPSEGLCVPACPTDGTSGVPGCVDVCQEGYVNQPAGCSEKCCKREICWDGSLGPQVGDDNCAVVCDDDRGITDDCLDFCPADGGFPSSGCICQGLPSDFLLCSSACCPPETAAPSSSSPSALPSALPSAPPTVTHSDIPTIQPSTTPSQSPSDAPSALPSASPSATPTATTHSDIPSIQPSKKPSQSTPFPTRSIEAQDELVTCISVIDENDSKNVETDWNDLREKFPDRPFCLLQPGAPGGLSFPSTYFDDPRNIFSNVTRDSQDVTNVSDWYNICNLNAGKPQGLTNVVLFVDNSGSMTTASVQNAFDLFAVRVAENGFKIVTAVYNDREDYIDPCLMTSLTTPAPVASPSSAPSEGLTEGPTQTISLTRSPTPAPVP